MKVNPQSPWAGELDKAVDRRDRAPAPAHRAERRARRPQDGRRPRRGRASSPRTCASCSSPRPSAPRWCSASTRGSAPAASAPSSTTPASSSSTRPSTWCRAPRRLERAPPDAARALQEVPAPRGRRGQRDARPRDRGLREGRARRGGPKEVFCVAVSEAGASVYSASDVAREEFPDLDLTVRGAVSIARRLQDPLAELVKIDPKSIGVGQYQHDVYQGLLAKKLDEVVESCVNLVGVELNTASAPLLSHVAGIGPLAGEEDRRPPRTTRARSRAAEGAPRRGRGSGPKTFEQAAGFLRVRGGEQPARRERRAPRALRAGGADRRGPRRASCALAGRRPQGRRSHRRAPLRRRRRRPLHPRATSSPS